MAIAACSGGGTVTGARGADNATFIYNMKTQVFTPLTQNGTNLLFYDPFPGTISEGGHDQAINNAGDVVGYIGAQGSTWQAAMWQPNGSGGGSIVNLNTEYASILPAGVTLNNATAIDNNGDIAGVCTDADNNTMQAFVIYAPLPGDANLDNKVDINDLTIVLTNFDRTGMTWTQGEFTGSGTVDVNDLTIVLSRFGQTAGAAVGGGLSTVAEPSATVLTVRALLTLFGVTWRRRKHEV